MEPRANVEAKVGAHGEWTVEMTWHDEDRNGPSQLVIRPTDPKSPPTAGISQTVLRAIQFPKTDMVSSLDEYAKRVPKIDWDTIGGTLADMSADGISDEYLAMLTVAYCVTSKAPKPLETLAEVTGKSPAAIKSHLWQATRKGFLERSPGRAGGRITPEAIDVLSPPTTT